MLQHLNNQMLLRFHIYLPNLNVQFHYLWISVILLSQQLVFSYELYGTTWLGSVIAF